MQIKNIISKEAREYIAATLRYKGEMPKSEVVEMIRPVCVFDPEQLQEEKLGKVASSIIQSIKSNDGTRKAYIIRGENSVIDIETCKSIEKVKKVEERLNRQYESVGKSRDKARNRRKQLEGQMAISGFEKEA